MSATVLSLQLRRAAEWVESGVDSHKAVGNRIAALADLATDVGDDDTASWLGDTFVDHEMGHNPGDEGLAGVFLAMAQVVEDDRELDDDSQPDDTDRRGRECSSCEVWEGTYRELIRLDDGEAPLTMG